MVNCQRASKGRTSRKGLPCNEKAMGQISMTEKNMNKNRPVMTKAGKDVMERKNRANRV